MSIFNVRWLSPLPLLLLCTHYVTLEAVGRRVLNSYRAIIIYERGAKGLGKRNVYVVPYYKLDKCLSFTPFLC